MTAYINIRNIKKITKESHDYKDRVTKRGGIVETITVETTDGTTIINLFKEVEE